MSTRSLRNRLADTTNIWPGFVDVLATLLIVIIFVLMVFTVSQIYLSDAISGRDKALQDLRTQINELSKILAKSLEANDGFNKDDLTKRYLEWWKKDAFDTGPTYASVFTNILNAVSYTHLTLPTKSTV